MTCRCTLLGFKFCVTLGKWVLLSTGQIDLSPPNGSEAKCWMGLGFFSLVNHPQLYNNCTPGEH